MWRSAPPGAKWLIAGIAVGTSSTKIPSWRSSLARGGAVLAWSARMGLLLKMNVVGLLMLTAASAKGQKAMTDQRPTAAFRAEHREVQEHLRHVHQWVGALSTQQAAEQRKTAQKVVVFFEKHIKPHAEWEERFLYLVVDKLAGGGPNAFTSTMRYEHRVVGRWIGELRAEADKERIDTARFSRRADNLLGLLWAHFEEEEEVLLPFIDNGMSKEQFERELGPGAGAHE